MEGRHVHPSTLYPGGVGTVATIQLMTDYLSRLMRYVEFMKKVVPMHDDLFDFFYEALPGYEQVGLRRTLLGCWGSFQDPEVCNFDYKDMTEWGRAMFVTPGVVVDGKLVTNDLVDINLGIRILLGSLLLRRLGGTGDVRHQRSARQSGRPAASVEPAHQPAAPKARSGRKIQLGDEPALVRRHRSSCARYRRRPDREVLGDGTGRFGGCRRLCQGDRPQRADQPAEDRAQAAGQPGVDDPAMAPTRIERNRARTYFQAYAAACALYFAEKALEEIHAGAPRPGRSSRCPTRASAAALPKPYAAFSVTTW